MKKFTKQEILELYGQVTLGEISFSQMVEIINERVREGEDIPAELEKGDLVIFWDFKKEEAHIGEYDYFIRDVPFPHQDHSGSVWTNAVKFESIEQYKRFIKGEK